MDQAILVALVMLVCVLTMLVLGIPISISIGLASTIAMLCVLPFENAMGTAAQKVFTGVNSFSLLAIPFFILAGNIMNNGGIAIRLVNCAKILSGRMPGALAETNVVANMLFGAISGSGVAAAAAIGGTIGPLEEKEGYSKDYMAAVNIASAPTGMLIPPSNTLIVYSTVAGSVSISALFMAGYLPGLLWGIGVMVIAGIMASKRGYRNRDEITLAIVLKTVWAAIPSLLLIVIVIGGILIGAFTATEGSAIAVVYSLLLSFIYRSIKIRDLRKILLDSVKMTAIVIFMIGVSSIMSWIMSFTNIPAIIADVLLGLTNSKIFTPIFLPICTSFGMHPIHFGIMIVFNLCIGTITPPVGPILFTGCKVANVKIEEVFKTLLPYFAVTAAILLLVTYVPAISMTIPNVLGLVK